MAVGPVFAGLMPAEPIMTHIEPLVEVQQIGPITLEDMIREKARANNLDEEKIIFIARCESQIEPEAIGDGHLFCARTQERVRSRGIWQINSCAHPEIADEQAFNPVLSTNWAIEIFKKGDESKEWKRCTNNYIKQYLATNN
ncbi:transglycosylase SLT domain-containing protein [Patescibacteria group bacterium]|nr:transglycosylase SLT domain-containing protein [Patescibacteria group bacterium]